MLDEIGAMPLGSWGEWVSGVGALLALFYAFWTTAQARRDARAARKEQKDEQATRDDEAREAAEAERVRLATDAARARANQLSWWLVRDAPVGAHFSRLLEDGPMNVNPDEQAGLESIALVLHNAGDVAMYFVRYMAKHAQTEDRRRHIGTLRPGQTWTTAPVPPGGTPGGALVEAYRMQTNADVEWVEYDTGDGRLWRRHADGQLTEVDERDTGFWRRFQ